MPLPEGYNPTEHLQDTVRVVTNRSVREWFSDVGGEDWEADIGTARGSLRVACTHRDDDSVMLTLLRLLLFSHEVGEARSLQAPVYAMPTSNTPIRRSGRPQIVLYFRESYRDNNEYGSPRDGRISFRLMNETSETLTNSNLVTIGQRIKTAFGGVTAFVWHKGRKMYCYADWEKGYQLQLLCTNEGEAKRVVEQVLDIQQHTPNWEYLTENSVSDELGRYPTTTRHKTILGKSRRLKQERLIVDVRFQYAYLHLDELPQPIMLYDHTGTHPDPIVSR